MLILTSLNRKKITKKVMLMRNGPESRVYSKEKSQTLKKLKKKLKMSLHKLPVLSISKRWKKLRNRP